MDYFTFVLILWLMYQEPMYILYQQYVVLLPMLIWTRYATNKPSKRLEVYPVLHSQIDYI